MSATELGIVGNRPRGAYSETTEYAYLDIVTDGGNSYLYINATPSTGTALTDATRWQIIAEKGDKGATGADGLTVSVCGVEHVDGDINLTASDIPTSTAGVSVQGALDTHTSQLADIANGSGINDGAITPRELSRSAYVGNVYNPANAAVGAFATGNFGEVPTYNTDVNFRHYVFDFSAHLTETIRIKMPGYANSTSIGLSFLTSSGTVLGNLTRTALKGTIGKVSGDSGYIVYITASTADYFELNVPVLLAQAAFTSARSVSLLIPTSEYATYYINAIKTYDLSEFIWLTNTTPIVESALDPDLSDKINNALYPSDVEILVPRYSRLPVLSTDLLPAYLDNVLLYCDPAQLMNIRSQNAYIKFYNKRIMTIDGTQGSGDLSGQIQLFFNDTKTHEMYKTLSYTIVPASAGDGVTKKVMFIGDSITGNLLYLTTLVTLFSTDVMNIELVGTLGTDIKHEGRQGWAAYNYIHDATFNGLSSAFWNAGTSAFDFANYMTVNGFAGVDYVFICLGTNDPIRVTTGMTDEEKEDLIVASYTTMINSILAYNASTEIVLWLPPTRSLIGSAPRKSVDSALLVNKWLMTAFDTPAWKNSGVHLLPIHYAVSPYADYATTTLTVGGETVTETSEAIHPAQSGADKIAKYIFNMIKWLVTT